MFTLETPRLILRDLAPQDEVAMHLLRSDPAVTRYCEYIASETPAQTRRWLHDTMAHNAAEPRLSYNLAIVRRSDGCVIGWIGIGRAQDPALGELDFGYALRPAFWGQGYATEALVALLGYAFRHLGAARIFGECDAENVASARVMEKAGLRLVKPTAGDGDGESLCFAASAAEWAQRQGAGERAT